MARKTENTIVISIAERLGASMIGEIVPHDALRLIVGAEKADHAYSYINRALKLISKEFGVEFATVRGEGYRRLAPGEGVVHAGDQTFRRIRRTVHRGKQRIGSALHFANDISPEKQKQANQRLGVLGIVDHVTRAATVKTMPEETPKQEKPDPLAGLRAALGM
jgi:hypothetical protein